nr:MAG TPA: hypothetical protein [Caudoviricetes sp.]
MTLHDDRSFDLETLILLPQKEASQTPMFLGVL